MLHLDLFSGIGGFAYAADQVWDNVEHVFCEIDPFCRQVLKKHWPESEVYQDVRQIITDSNCVRLQKAGSKQQTAGSWRDNIDLLTGGFPCQSFSQAGSRRGTSDVRWLWPAMFEVIQATKPTWVIAENVDGILTWGEGVAAEQVCADLEAEGYEVQPFVIPAAAVGAPHRRDRIWFVAHAVDSRPRRTQRRSPGKAPRLQTQYRSENSTAGQPERTDSNRAALPSVTDPGRKHGKSGSSDEHGQDTAVRSSKTTQAERRSETASDTSSQGSQGRRQERSRPGRQPDRVPSNQRPNWEEDWLTLATEFCSVDDGLPVELDGFKLSKAQHRKEQLKAYGNAIVPAVAVEIMKGMDI